jgi:hypothetical protein
MVLYPGGMDFGEFMPDDFEPGTTGFEAGIPIPLNISIDILIELWDEENPSSLLNIDGIALWFEANSSETIKNELTTIFGLTEEQMDGILTWLWIGSDSFSQGLLPTLINSEMGYGMDIPDLSIILLFEQWANGTFMDMDMYPNGLDFGEFMPDQFEPGTTGFEVGSETPTGLTIDQIEDLWDTLNEYSLTNITGIEKWLEANTNDAIKANLTSIFGITSDQTQMILDWLWDGPDSFSQGLLPTLLESELGYNMTLTEFAKVLMLEQWANGTIMGMTMFEGGIDFHDFISSLPVGSTGFEVGVPFPTNMSVESALLLWDLSNPYSLVKDISVWWGITSKASETYATVRDANKLNDEVMDMILDWLPDFKNNLMPALAQYEMGLPMDTINLGNTIQIGGMLIGAVAIGLASTGLISNRVVSKKKKTVVKGDKTTKKFDKLIGTLQDISRDLNEDIDSNNAPFDGNSEPRDDEKYL